MRGQTSKDISTLIIISFKTILEFGHNILLFLATMTLIIINISTYGCLFYVIDLSNKLVTMLDKTFKFPLLNDNLIVKQYLSVA